MNWLRRLFGRSSDTPPNGTSPAVPATPVSEPLATEPVAAEAATFRPPLQTRPLPPADGGTRPLPADPLPEITTSEHITFAQSTDVGMVRSNNQDAVLSFFCATRSVDERPDFGLFAVADGMGGHPEGEVASQLALQTLSAMFQREAKPKLAEPLRFLNDAIIAGHHQLLRYATERGLVDTPRTTLVACLLQGNAAFWAHCGDSRLYLVRGDKLVARTRDHSYSELQETLAQVVPMGDKYNRNVLFTCLGSPGKPVVDTAGPLLMHPGDRVLLCSDGLWGALSDQVITEVLAHNPISDAVPDLVERALREAGAKSDNVTVLAVEWEAAEDAEAQAGISTLSLGEEVFASTIQASLGGDASTDDLDDAEIERSIREINEAIQRSSARKR